MTADEAEFQFPSQKLKRRVAKEELEQRWAGFANLPGTHLSWHKTGWGKFDLVTTDGEVWASADSEHFSVRGQTYEKREISKSTPDLAWSGVIDKTEWVVDEAGIPVLRFEGWHFERRAYTKLWLTDQSVLSFPVIGRWNRAVMSAIDESGNPLIHYRLGPPTHRLPISNYNLKWVESVVCPTAHEIPEIALIVASTPWLLCGYFVSRSSGG